MLVNYVTLIQLELLRDVSNFHLIRIYDSNQHQIDCSFQHSIPLERINFNVIIYFFTTAKLLSARIMIPVFIEYLLPQ